MKPTTVTLLLILPIIGFGQNPFNCNYQDFETIEQSNTPNAELYFSSFNGLNKNCLNNDLEFSRYVNELVFENLSDSTQFNEIIGAIDKLDSEQFELVDKYLLSRPISENYKYEQIKTNIGIQLNVRNNSERITTILHKLLEIY